MSSSGITVQKLQLIWTILFVVSIAFLFAVIYLFNTEIKPLSSEQNLLTSIAAFIAIVNIIAGYLIFGKRIRSINAELPVDAKLSAYFVAFLIKISLSEISLLFTGVVLLLTGDSAALILSALVLVMMILSFPSASKIGLILSLSEEEINKVRGKLGIN